MDFALSKLNDLISVFERIPPDEMYRNMLVALKEEKLSPSIIVHQFNDWRDIFDTFIDDNQIKLHVDPTDLDPVFKSYRFKMQKNVLISQLRKLKYKLCEQLVKTDYQPMFDSIPKQYLSSLIEQYALKALYDADRMGISYDSVRNVISSQNNNTLYHIFSFLEWNESYRVVYDESKHYQSIFDQISESVLNDEFLNIIKTYVGELYVGFVRQCQCYIVIPKYHPWSSYLQSRQWDQIPVDVHGGVTWLRNGVRENMQNQYKTTLCLDEGVCIGWDYYHSGGLFVRPGYDYGKRLTFDVAQNDVLKAIRDAHLAPNYN
eukprot:89376_1